MILYIYLWMPNFPKDVYEQYQDAYEAGDAALIETSSRQLEITIQKNGKGHSR